MATYYGVERSSEYLKHYGRPGQKRGQHLPDIQALLKNGEPAPYIQKSRAYQNAKARLEQHMAEAKEFEQNDEGPEQVEDDTDYTRKNAKKKAKRKDALKYKQRQSNEKYYNEKNKYSTPGLSGR